MESGARSVAQFSNWATCLVSRTGPLALSLPPCVSLCTHACAQIESFYRTYTYTRTHAHRPEKINKNNGILSKHGATGEQSRFPSSQVYEALSYYCMLPLQRTLDSTSTFLVLLYLSARTTSTDYTFVPVSKYVCTSKASTFIPVRTSWVRRSMGCDSG